MKALMIAAALIVSLPAHAELTQCEMQSKLAHKIMEARQLGVDLADMMRVSDNASANMRAITRPLTLAAYSKSRYNTPENQRKAAQDFANDVMFACLTRE